ncbi:aldo/keto reductase, partial [Candidatus Sumerlaeota bacterium]|nr:aldo/keto reductase [Candidatus Sumerlaeota bacterium]
RTDCIDVYYLHNPEAQLGKRTPDEFYKSLRAAFELLEKKVAEGKIRMYGTATWNGYRAQRSARDYLSLERVVKTAEEVGGKEHHFMVVQLPYNLALPEALLKQNQPAGGELVGFFEAAQYFGITVMTSVPTMQGQLAKNLPPQVGKILPGLLTDAQRAIQFVRSTRGVTAALVGMKQKSHVAENLETGKVPPVSESSLLKLFEFK